MIGIGQTTSMLIFITYKMRLQRICQLNYHSGMKTTIDKAGRLVIPKRLREQFHFRDGVTIEITADNEGLRLRLPQGTCRLIEKEGVLVQEAERASSVDATDFINQQRNSHALQNFPSVGSQS